MPAMYISASCRRPISSLLSPSSIRIRSPWPIASTAAALTQSAMTAATMTRR